VHDDDEERQRRRLPERDPGRPVHQPPVPGLQPRPRRPVRAGQAEVRRGQPNPRRHHQGIIELFGLNCLMINKTKNEIYYFK
jgi:hypothetical protein